MKLLDRYVLTTFLKNYIISLAVLIGMYVVMDMVFNFDQIITVQKQVGANSSGLFSILAVVKDVSNYYFYQSFLIFVELSGIIPVVAAAFTLLRFSRFSELTAFLAAGVPLLRVTIPIIVASVLLNVFLVVDQEFVLPGMIPQLTRTHEELHTSAPSSFRIRSMQVGAHSLLIAADYQPPTATTPATMEEMDVLERNDAMEPVSHLFATTATWDASHHRWNLADGRRVTGLLPRQIHSDEQPVSFYQGEVTPEEIALYHSSGFVELLSTKRINELIARPKSYGVNNLYKVKYLRATQPLMNVVLLLLAIPTVLTHDPKSLKMAASKCLILTGLAMGSVFLTQQIANNPPVGPLWASTWPLLMAWIPLFIFGPMSVWLLTRIRT